VPAAVQAKVAEAGAAASLYIDSYNVWMHHLVDDKGQRLFPKGKKLISHWNLRDELKAAYADKDGLPRQRMIVQVMERIVTQTIPAAVIDNPQLDWNPFTNAVTVAERRSSPTRPGGPPPPAPPPSPTCATSGSGPTTPPRARSTRTRPPRPPSSSAPSRSAPSCPKAG
jgi:hypothetical protein